MRILIFLMLSVSASLNAQIEKIWQVYIEGAYTDPRLYDDALSVSQHGAVLLSIPNSPSYDPITGDAKHLPALAWITRDGGLKYIWMTGDNSKPSKQAILIFNDDYIVTMNNGGVWIWEVVDGKIERNFNQEFGEGAWLFQSHVRTYPQDGTFLGVSIAFTPNASGITLTNYRLKPKNPAFQVQSSDNLIDWKPLLDVPQSSAVSEFYRIWPKD